MKERTKEKIVHPAIQSISHQQTKKQSKLEEQEDWEPRRTQRQEGGARGEKAVVREEV